MHNNLVEGWELVAKTIIGRSWSLDNGSWLLLYSTWEIGFYLRRQKMFCRKLLGVDQRLSYFVLNALMMTYSYHSNLAESFHVFEIYFHFINPLMQHRKGMNAITAIPTITVLPTKHEEMPSKASPRFAKSIFFAWTAGTWKPAPYPILCNLSKFEYVHFLCHYYRNLFQIKFRKYLIYSCKISKQRCPKSDGVSKIYAQKVLFFTSFQYSSLGFLNVNRFNNLQSHSINVPEYL